MTKSIQLCSLYIHSELPARHPERSEQEPGGHGGQPHRVHQHHGRRIRLT